MRGLLCTDNSLADEDKTASSDGLGKDAGIMLKVHNLKKYMWHCNKYFFT